MSNNNSQLSEHRGEESGEECVSRLKVCVDICRCPSWSEDEKICVRSVNNELHFYENNDFSKKLHLTHCFLLASCLLPVSFLSASC